jgi:lipopolysaccharide cholinephosphotransferase
MYTVIFGCGNYGRWALNCLGTDRVDYFCDNNFYAVGGVLEGIEIISYESLLKLIHENDNVLLVLGLNKINAELVEEQLNADGIDDYVLAKDVFEGYGDTVIEDEKFAELASKAGRSKFIINRLKERIARKQKQLDYFKRHADIHNMKPAVGKLREKQLKMVRKTKETLDFIEKNCGVKCWITSGTLIGYLRHNGFIPWDDDMDFGILRKDLDKLTEFFLEYSAVLDYDICTYKDESGAIVEIDGSTLEETAEKSGDKYFLWKFMNFMRIEKMGKDGVETALELFSFDYYTEETTIEDYHKYTSNGFIEKRREHTMRKLRDYINDRIKNSGLVCDKPTNKILPGIDSFVYHGLWDIQKFLSYEDVFPLKEIEFEGEHFYCVNNPQKYIVHEYPDWEEFPNDIGVVEGA